jgi:exopolyphosphatase/guanosine-5'-triphosphate,3'-diphosphate pyrophosphatase
VCLADHNGILWTRSFPLGAGRVTSELVRHDPPTRAERRAVRDAVRQAFEGSQLPALEGAHAVASGGTAGALGRLLATRRWGTVPPSLNQFEMRLDELVPVSRELASLTLEDRLQIPGIDERRAHLLPAGGIVLTTAARSLDISSLTLSEWGLREGVVLEALGLARRSAPSPARLREGSIRQLRDVWVADRAHAATIGRLALSLFDATVALHGAGPVERELLEYAATLHDLGTKISTDRSHKHGSYLIEHAPLKGFDPEEVFLLASVVRFQKGSPGSSFEPFARLEADARERCRLLIGLLRVAHALGHANPRDAEALDVRATPDRVRIRVTGSGNPRGAVAEARSKADLLARALDADVEVLVAPSEAVSA